MLRRTRDAVAPGSLLARLGQITEEEVLELLELEAEPSLEDGEGLGQGWVPQDGSGPRLELWQQASSDEAQRVFALRCFAELPGVHPRTATKLLYDAAARKKWDQTVEVIEELPHRSVPEQSDILHLRMASKRCSALPACDVLHGRLRMAPCGDAHAAWLCRDVDADVEQADGTWAGGFYQWAGMLQRIRVEGAVVGHVVRSWEGGCRVFSYLHMQASVVTSLGPQLAAEMIQGLSRDFEEACRAEEDANRHAHPVAEEPGQSTPPQHLPEIFDMSVGDETGSATSEASSLQVVQAGLAAGLDFLGVVENKKLVPAVSAFRRLLRKSEKGAVRQKAEVRSACEASGSRPSERTSGDESGRRRRSSALREKNRERQRGSMEAVAERLGEAVRMRTQHGRDSALEVVPEEVEEDAGLKAKLHQSDAEKQVAQTAEKPPKAADGEVGAPPPVQRKRFSLPLPTRRRRSSARSVGTDSEDSMSSASVSEAAGDVVPGRGSTAAGAVDAFFDRARAARREGSSALSTTTASSISSRGSSPRLGSGTPGTSFGGASSTSEAQQVAKPTLAGAAWVLTQLCKESSAQPATDPPSEQPSSVSTESQVATRTLRGSLMSADAFKFCFPQDICGVPLESKAALKDSGWKRSSNRTRRRASAA